MTVTRENMTALRADASRLPGGERVIAHSLLVMFLTQAAGVSNVAFHLLAGRLLTREQYGILATMLNLVFVLLMPLQAVQNTLAHFTARLLHEGRRDAIRAMARLWSFRLLAAAVVLLVVTAAGRGPMGAFFRMQNTTPLLLTAAAMLPSLVLPVFVGVQQGAQRFIWMSVAAQGWGLVRLVLLGLLLWLAGRHASWGIVAHGLAVACSLAVGVWGMLRVSGPPSAAPAAAPRGDRYFGLTLLSLGGFSMLMYGDTALVKHFFPAAADYGSYAQASTIGRTVLFLALPVASAMFPKVVSTRHAGSDRRAVLRQSVLLQLAVVAASCAACVGSAKWILWGLFGAGAVTPQSVHLVRMLTVAMAPLSLTFLLMNYGLAQGRFASVAPLVASAAAYVGGVCFFHDSLQTVALVLGAACALALVWLTAATFLSRRREHAEPRSPPAP